MTITVHELTKKQLDYLKDTFPKIEFTTKEFTTKIKAPKKDLMKMFYELKQDKSGKKLAALLSISITRQEYDISFSLEDKQIKFSKKFTKNISSKKLKEFAELFSKLTTFEHFKILKSFEKLFTNNLLDLPIHLEYEEIILIYLIDRKNIDKFFDKWIKALQMYNNPLKFISKEENEYVDLRHGFKNDITTKISAIEHVEIFEKHYDFEAEVDTHDIHLIDNENKKALKSFREYELISNLFTDKEIFEAALPVLKKELKKRLN